MSGVGAGREAPSVLRYNRRLPPLQGPDRMEAQVSPFPTVLRSGFRVFDGPHLFPLHRAIFTVQFFCRFDFNCVCGTARIFLFMHFCAAPISVIGWINHINGSDRPIDGPHMFETLVALAPKSLLSLFLYWVVFLQVWEIQASSGAWKVVGSSSITVGFLGFAWMYSIFWWSFYCSLIICLCALKLNL